MGAYKNAFNAFQTARPDVALDFFALRGPLFLTGQMDAQGIFTPPLRDDKDRALVIATNGSETVDASGYDQLLLVGHRFAFNNVATLLEDRDLLEGVRSGRKHLISEAMLTDTIIAMTEAAVAEATAPFSHWDKPATFAMAPYPATSITERGTGYALARLMGQFWERPDAAWVFETWLDTLRAALATRGYGLLEQPAATVDGPFATVPAYAQKAAGVAGDTLATTDHRHMNADFGLAMLLEYADNHLAGAETTTAPRQKTERIA